MKYCSVILLFACSLLAQNEMFARNVPALGTGPNVGGDTIYVDIKVDRKAKTAFVSKDGFFVDTFVVKGVQEYYVVWGSLDSMKLTRQYFFDVDRNQFMVTQVMTYPQIPTTIERKNVWDKRVYPTSPGRAEFSETKTFNVSGRKLKQWEPNTPIIKRHRLYLYSLSLPL